MFPQSQICWWILILEIIFGESRAPCDWSHIADLSDVSCVEPLRTLPGPFINPTHLHPPPYTYVLFLKIHIVLLFAHYGLFLLYNFKCTEKVPFNEVLWWFARERSCEGCQLSLHVLLDHPTKGGGKSAQYDFDWLQLYWSICTQLQYSKSQSTDPDPPGCGPQPTWRVTWLVSHWQNWELWPTAKSSWLPVTLFLRRVCFLVCFTSFLFSSLPVSQTKFLPFCVPIPGAS